MPRRPRALQHASFYHLVNRASLRARLFFDGRDYDAFVGLLGETVERYQLPLLAYCVMPNHWHLVAGPVSIQNISRSMHWLTGTHAIRWAAFHERPGPGPVYQGRFKSIPIESDIHLARACRYVERNASCASLARHAEDWTWCSAHQRLQNGTKPLLAATQFLPQDAWLRFLNDPMFDAEMAAAIRKNLPFGSDAWTRAWQEATGRSPTGERGRPRVNK